MKEFWNERFAEEEYIYGKEPNMFFKETLAYLKPGNILLPAEGEGRNAVFAARQGWKVDGFDFSEKAMQKALRLAKENNVNIHYSIQDFNTVQLPENTYDAVGLFYAHLPSEIRRNIHQKAVKSLRLNGRIILEAFSKKQIHNTSGGPKDINMLYTTDELKKDFDSLLFHTLEEKEIIINQGKYHQGNASVVRVICLKTKTQ